MEQKRILGALSLVFGAALGLIVGILLLESISTGILYGAALGMLVSTQINNYQTKRNLPDRQVSFTPHK
jgi:hypothetical protein